jgi:hypothetical protein
MPRNRHLVEWHGTQYVVEPLRTNTRVSSLPPVWAISRGREFIGTLPMRPEETTKEFEVRCASWLEDLFGPSQRAWKHHSEQSRH